MSTTPHKATPEQWANVEQAKDPIEIHPGVLVGDKNTTIAICILELRARVEALEEAENDRRFEQAKAILGKPAPAPSGSLVERVMDAGGMGLPESARAAIRAVAGWLRDRGGYPWAWVAQILEKEAGR